MLLRFFEPGYIFSTRWCVFSDLIGQRRRRGRSRRRNILPDLSGDLQGNDYEVRRRRKSAAGQLFELRLMSDSVEQI